MDGLLLQTLLYHEYQTSPAALSSLKTLLLLLSVKQRSNAKKQDSLRPRKNLCYSCCWTMIKYKPFEFAKTYWQYKCWLWLKKLLLLVKLLLKSLENTLGRLQLWRKVKFFLEKCYFNHLCFLWWRLSIKRYLGLKQVI